MCVCKVIRSLVCSEVSVQSVCRDLAISLKNSFVLYFVQRSKI